MSAPSGSYGAVRGRLHQLHSSLEAAQDALLEFEEVINDAPLSADASRSIGRRTARS